MNDADVYTRQGFGHSSGFGQRPAIVVVDFVVGFADPDKYGGGNIGEAIARTEGLLAAARERDTPIAYTRIVYAPDGSDAGAFCLKVPGLEKFTEDHPDGQIVPELEPARGDFVVRKTQPSAFFGTNLAPWLVSRGADTVIVTGCTTSGCVRATVVDAMSWNYRVVVASDGVGDRALGPHEANLFDMRQKYADVLTCAEIADALASN